MVSCKKCGKEYKSSSSLWLHQRYCIEGIIFGCSLCPASFKQKHNQENHMKGTHEGGFSCNECSFTTKYNTSLSIHESIHHSGIVFPVNNAHLEQLVSKHLSDMTKSSMKVLSLGVQNVVIRQQKNPR